jgi:hypothetical protein
VKKTVYCAIRQTGGREWIDINTVELDAEMAQFQADEVNGIMPSYAQNNPVVRIAKCLIEEVHD